MTTREELIDGLRMVIREGLRTTAAFGADDWKAQVHDEEGGWNVKQVYCHLTATVDALPGFAALLAQSKEGQNPGAGFDINAFNAQGVADRQGMSESELMGAFKTSHEKAIDLIQNMPQEQLEQRRSFGPIEGTIAEIADTALVLHALSHIYHAADRPIG
jgi:hypothetical protein